MAALQYVDVPGYAAMIFRKTYSDLSRPGALMDRARAWLANTTADWSERTKTWTFPSGATLSFGYMESAGDHHRYDGSQLTYCGFDEASHFLEEQYLYMFSRQRRLKGVQVPLRMHAAGNPGGRGHFWIKDRFITGEKHPDRTFIRSSLEDNPALDKEDYLKSLGNLMAVEYRQLVQGDWTDYEGGRFQRDWFRRFHETDSTYDLYKKDDKGQWRLLRTYPKEHCWKFGTCDPAASTKNTADYTCAGAWCVTPRNELLCLEVLRKRFDVEAIVPALSDLCARHRLRYMAIEEAGMQAMMIAEARRFPGMPAVRGVPHMGQGKLERATPAIIRAESGQFYLPERAHWLEDFVAELCAFSGDPDKDAFDDQVDMASMAGLEMDRMSTSSSYPLKNSDVARRGIRPGPVTAQPRLQPRQQRGLRPPGG